MPQPKNNGFKNLNNYARYSGLAFEMLGIIALGTWGGIRLDARLDISPLFTIVLSLGSIAVSMYMVIKKAGQSK